MLFFFPTALAGFHQLVADPVGVLLADANTPAGFRIVALSNAAEACVQLNLSGELALDQAVRCVDNLAAAALDARVSPWETPGVGELGEHNLYATHLAIVLAARDRLHPEACDLAVHQRVAEHLVERSLAHPDGLARSFPSSASRWPADQAATVYALHRYDQAHGSHLGVEPLERYLGWIERARTPQGLLPSERTGTSTDAEVPRGSSMTWTTRYLAAVAPEVAAGLWAATRTELVVKLGPAYGIREWPSGQEHAADIDSGPIVANIGASATVFGIGASRAVGDLDSWRALSLTEGLGRMLSETDEGMAAARDSALAAAISENQASLRPWD